MKKVKKFNFSYPQQVTETFDNANFHINYCVSFFRKYLEGNVIEIGAGCGSFTRSYFKKKTIKSLILNDKDKKNILTLSKKFKKKRKIQVTRSNLSKINKKFETILYLHVLEHIENDENEIRIACKKLKKNGKLIILVPAHNKMYSNLDKFVGHHRRYEASFFKKRNKQLKLVNLKFLDSSGYLLYYLNKLFFRHEKIPSKLKIFIWDKLFTPISLIFDFILGYRLGKCILAIYERD